MQFLLIPVTWLLVAAAAAPIDGVAEAECPPCDGPDDCPCPAVKIMLRERPAHFRLEVDNAPMSNITTTTEPAVTTSHPAVTTSRPAVTSSPAASTTQTNESSLARFNHLVVFGDSLSDNGNSRFLWGWPQAPYYDGRWSNGPIWVDYFPSIAHHFSSGIEPYFPTSNGTNFAIAGAISADLLTPESTGFPAQIPTYLNSTGGRAFPDDLYLIWMGGNDFAEGASPTDTAANIRNGIISLQQAGAINIVVVSVPDISVTPDGIELGESVVSAAHQWAIAVNALLVTQIQLYGSSNGMNIQFIDITATLHELTVYPELFGFTTSTGVAFNTSLPTGPTNPVPNADDYVWWDGMHPTTKGHNIAARTLYQMISERQRRSLIRSVPKRFSMARRPEKFFCEASTSENLSISRLH